MSGYVSLRLPIKLYLSNQGLALQTQPEHSYKLVLAFRRIKRICLLYRLERPIFSLIHNSQYRSIAHQVGLPGHCEESASFAGLHRISGHPSLSVEHLHVSSWYLKGEKTYPLPAPSLPSVTHVRWDEETELQPVSFTAHVAEWLTVSSHETVIQSVESASYYIPNKGLHIFPCHFKMAFNIKTQNTRFKVLKYPLSFLGDCYILNLTKAISQFCQRIVQTGPAM